MNYNDPGAVPPTWKVGDVILDRYEVKQVFTSGGMGLVYRVHHRDWDMELAAKSPRPEFFQSQQQIENFEREAETWVNLGLHPHIVSCYYVRRLGCIPRIFAEYVEGGTLADWIRTKQLYAGGKEKGLERVIDIAIQFAWGLQFAHENGLVHQDVKPGNVLLSPDGTAKVSDFGLANARRASAESTTVAERAGQSILVPGSGFMTPAYASPEQLRGEHLSRKSDVWSWAVSLLEMLLGELTWTSGLAAPAVLEDSDNTFDAPLIVLLQSCFSTHPNSRSTSFEPVIALLLGYYAHRFGQYQRAAPKPMELLADGLNNRAVSLLDLGKRSEGIEEFGRALQKDPLHTAATFNRGLALWQESRFTDSDFAARFEQFQRSKPTDATAARLLGHIHLVRGDAKRAIGLLEKARENSEGEETESLLRQACHLAEVGAVECAEELRGHTNWVLSVCMSQNHRWALSAGYDKCIRLWDTSTGRCVRSILQEGTYAKTLALSSDSLWALSGDVDGRLRVWDLSTGVCVRVIEGHSDLPRERVLKGHVCEVNSVCLSADDRWALSGSWDGTLRLWELATGRCARVIDRVGVSSRGPVDCVYLSADAKWALDSCYPMALWDLTNGNCVRVLKGHTHGIQAVCISADKTLILSGGGNTGGSSSILRDEDEARKMDCHLRLWDAATGECLRVFAGHRHAITSVCLSSDERWAVSGSIDRTVRIWELSTGRCLRTLEGHTDRVSSVCISPDSDWVLSGSWDNTVRIWRVGSLRLSRELHSIVCKAAHTTHVQDAMQRFRAFLRDARSALLAGDCAAALHYATAARGIPGYAVASEALDVWNEAGLRGTRFGLRSAWNVHSWRGDHRKNAALSVCFAAGRQAALSGGGRHLGLWDVATGKGVRSFDSNADEVCAAYISDDGRFLLCGSGSSQERDDEGDDSDYESMQWTVHVWDAASGERLRTFEGHTGDVLSLSMSKDSRLVASGSKDKTLRVWDMQTGTCLHTLDGHDDEVSSVCFSADGAWILSGSPDTTLRLWDVSTGGCVQIFRGHENWVWSVALSLDGKRALSGSADTTLRVWDIKTGKCVHVLTEHTDAVWAVCISLDGHWGISGSQDKTLRVWDLFSGRCVHVLEGHVDSVISVALSADCRWVLSGGSADMIRLWELDWDFEAHERAATWQRTESRAYGS